MNNSYYPSSNPLMIPLLEIGFGLSLIIIGGIMSYFTYDSYCYYKGKEGQEADEREKERVERERKRASMPRSRPTRGNPYRRQREKKSNKKP